jgi:DivIVA domain-containing protein
MTSDDSHGPGIGPGNSPATGPIGAAAVPPPQTGPIGGVRPADPATGGVRPADPATGGLLGSPPTGPVDAAAATGGLLGVPPTGQVTAIGPRLTPESVRRAAFDRAGIGRRGYSEADVERFRNRVVQEIGQANAEKAELRREHQRLRAEIQRLRDYYRRNRVDVDKSRGPEPPPGPVYEEPPTGELVPVGPSADSVNVMSRAQQAADQHIAQAEDYARRLVSGARRQYEEILLAAQNQADQAAAEAREAYERAARSSGGAASSAEVDEIQERVTYLRTFAQVTQVQLRSILDGLRQELDKLTLPAPDGPPTGRDREAARTPPTESGRVLGQVNAPQLGGSPQVGRAPEPGRGPGGGPAHAAPSAYGTTSPATGPMRAVPTPPRGFPARGTLPVRTP